jgi:hypothetical protein
MNLILILAIIIILFMYLFLNDTNKEYFRPNESYLDRIESNYYPNGDWGNGDYQWKNLNNVYLPINNDMSLDNALYDGILPNEFDWNTMPFQNGRYINSWV